MALCLLMSVVPVGSAEANNKLTIAVGLANTSKGVDNVWFWKWARDNFDIDFDLVGDSVSVHGGLEIPGFRQRRFAGHDSGRRFFHRRVGKLWFHGRTNH